MLWLAAHVAGELRQQAIASANRVTARVSDAVDDLTRNGQGVRDDVADVVARSVHEVERFATASKTAADRAQSRNA